MKALSEIPWEIWHQIFREVYADAAESNLPPHLEDPKFVLTPLHKRLLNHRNLSLVSKHFHQVSNSVFFEELHLLAPESLNAVASTVLKDASLARVVRRLSFDFSSYRCGASAPRRVREYKDISSLNTDEPLPPDYDPIAQAEYRHRRATNLRMIQSRWNYKPSGTRQRSHYTGWTGFIRTILSACTGVLYVSINFEADYSEYLRRPSASSNYRTLFGAPDIIHNEAILSGLQGCTNLRDLELSDPSPLDKYGSGLSSWKLLNRVAIHLSPKYPEARRLEDAVFTPPKFLKSFRLNNHSNYMSALPTTADLSFCTDLEDLQLGELDLSSTPTILAAAFLVTNYQYSLTRLHLSIRVRQGMRDVSSLLNYGNIHFPKLKTLIVEHGECSASLFASFRANSLEEVGIRSLRVSRDARADFGGGPGIDEDEFGLDDFDGFVHVNPLHFFPHAPIPLALPSEAPPVSASNAIPNAPTQLPRSFNPDAQPSEDAYWHAFFSLPSLNGGLRSGGDLTLKRFHVRSMTHTAKEAMMRVAHEKGIDTSSMPGVPSFEERRATEAGGMPLTLNGPPVGLPPWAVAAQNGVGAGAGAGGAGGQGFLPAPPIPTNLPGFDFGPGLGLGPPPQVPVFGLGGAGGNGLANLITMAGVQMPGPAVGQGQGQGQDGAPNAPQMYDDEGGAGDDEEEEDDNNMDEGGGNVGQNAGAAQ